MHFEKKTTVQQRRIKNQVLLGVNGVMFLIVLAFWNSQGAIINTIFKIAGYTYGPLLGLYLTGFFTRYKLKEKWVPLVCIAAAGLTWVLNDLFMRQYGFDLGFMNIGLNAGLTIVLLYLIKSKQA
jgi:hypothetical protein